MELKELKQREEQRAKNKALIKSGRLAIAETVEHYPSGTSYKVVKAILDGYEVISLFTLPNDYMSAYDFEKMAIDKKEREAKELAWKKAKADKVSEIIKEAEKHGFTVKINDNDSVSIYNGADYLVWVNEILKDTTAEIIDESESEKVKINNYKTRVEMIKQAVNDGRIKRSEEMNDRFIITDNNERTIALLKNYMRWDLNGVDIVDAEIKQRDTEDENEAKWIKADESTAEMLLKIGLKAVFDGSWLIKYKNTHLLRADHLTRCTKSLWQETTAADFVPIYKLEEIIREMK